MTPKEEFDRLLEYYLKQDHENVSMACASTTIQLYRIYRDGYLNRELTSGEQHLCREVKKCLYGCNDPLKVTKIKT